MKMATGDVQHARQQGARNDRPINRAAILHQCIRTKWTYCREAARPDTGGCRRSLLRINTDGSITGGATCGESEIAAQHRSFGADASLQLKWCNTSPMADGPRKRGPLSSVPFAAILSVATAFVQDQTPKCRLKPQAWEKTPPAYAQMKTPRGRCQTPAQEESLAS